MDKDSLVGDDMDGYCELKMDTLRDQLMHDVWMDLKNSKGETISGKLHLIAQWIHSGRTFYADFMSRIQAKIEKEQTEKSRLESQLDKIRGTFSLPHRVEPHGVFFNLDTDTLATLDREEESRPIATTLMGSVLIVSPQNQTWDPLGDFSHGENLLWSLLVLCSILASAFRLDIVNVILHPAKCIGMRGSRRICVRDDGGEEGGDGEVDHSLSGGRAGQRRAVAAMRRIRICEVA